MNVELDRPDHFDRTDSAGRTGDDMDEILRLLFAALSRRAEILNDRVQSIEKTAEAATSPEVLAAVLPNALQLASSKEVGKVIRPLVEEAIIESVQRNPEVMANAVSPLLLPAIKRAIVEYFHQIVQVLDKSLEQSLSVQGMLWRIEAFKTGKSFSEIVLLHSLIYRVDEVFLIHKPSGILLAQVSRKEQENRDEVAGMLTAIRDFVQDSFEGEAGFGLRTMEVGTVSVWIEDLAHASIAAVIRGEAPQEYRTKLSEVGRLLCATHGGVLAKYTGDSTPFQRAHEVLNEALVESFHNNEGQAKRRGRRQHLIKIFLMAMILSVFAFSVYVSFSHYRVGKTQQRELETFLKVLEKHPGVIVLSTALMPEGVTKVRAMRDRLVDLSPIHPPPSVQMTWGEFVSSDPFIVAKRARSILKAPSTVIVFFKDGTLHLSGKATQEWIQSAERMAPTIAGLESVHMKSLKNLDQSELEAAMANLESMTLPTDQYGLPSGFPAQDWLNRFTQATLSLDRHARVLGLTYYLLLQSKATPVNASRARKRLAQLSGVLSWRLQEKGITTYRLIRTEVLIYGQFPPNNPLKIRVIRHGTTYPRR